MSSNDSNATVLDYSPSEVQDHARVRRLRASDVAAVITMIVVLGTAATTLLPIHLGAGIGGFTYEDVRMIGVVDTSSQRLAHRVGLVLLAALCVLGAAAITRPAGYRPNVIAALRIVGRFLRRWCGVLLVAAAAMVPIFDIHFTVFSGHGAIFAGPDGGNWWLRFWLISLCLTALRLLWVRQLKARAIAVGVWSCIAAYGLFLMTPGLARSPFIFEPLLSWTEAHFNWTVAQGDRLAAGLRLGTQVNLNYGLIPSLFVGAFERHWGFLNFGEHFRLIQVSQVAFLAVAILAFYLWRPGNPVFVLFGAMLIGPWVSTSHMAVYYPNQSGWRNLGLAAGAVLLLLCRQQPIRRAAWMLGAGACFLLLYNPETGLCLSFGYGLFLLSRQRNLKLDQIGGLALRAATGAVIVLLAVLIFYRAGLGAWPPLRAALPFGLIAKFGLGYAGRPLYFDPLAVLIFIHSAYVVSSTALKWRLRDLEFEESVKLGMAATILTWASYYVNRPQPWDLWTHTFLYIFLIADIFEPRFFSRLRSRGIAAIFDFRLAALTFVLVPVLLFNNYYILLRTLHPPGGSAAAITRVSGISMPSASANTLRTQADFLMSQNPSSTLFFSIHSYSLSLLAQRFSPLRVQDALSETITNSDFEVLVADIYRLSPRVILFDPPDDNYLPVIWAPENSSVVVENPAITYFYMQFFDRLKSRLSARYQQGPITGGWQVWQLRQPGGSSDVEKGISAQ